MSFRLASYAVCTEEERVLLVHHRPTDQWTLAGGGVEHGEDPIDAVVRELREETGLEGRPQQLLGIDSRVIPAAERLEPGEDHHNVGVFYEVTITGGAERLEPDLEIVGVRWVPVGHVPRLRRSSLVDGGMELNRLRPRDGHVAPVPIGGLLEH